MQTTIEGVIDERGESTDLLFASGYVNYELGNYFSDEKYYAAAVKQFQKVLAQDGAHRLTLFALYLTQSLWGWQKRERRACG